YLPKFDDNETTSEMEITPEITIKGSETTIIAEDNDMILKLSKKILSDLGYHVLLANNGEEALKISEDFDGPIDLLLTDVIMPGINGMELAQQLKLRREETKVIFMSGYTGSNIFHNNILRLGMPFITKPFTKDSLSLKVRQVLDESEVKLEAAV
ncbi:MAG: response regulator, partial [Desulfobacterales bacterium]|nr:response regulator [Desulfobacterales bacterium]